MAQQRCELEPWTVVGSRRADVPPLYRSILLLLLCSATGCASDATAVTPPCGEAPLLIAGEPVVATLAPGNSRRGGSYIHHYTVWPDEPMDVRIEMTSAAVEPFLFLFDESGTVIAQATAALATRAPQTATLEWSLTRGCYTVGASTWAADSRGPYSLRLDRADAP
jgi:hypothetical protein